MISFPASWIRDGFFVLGGLLLLIALAQIINSIRYGGRMPLNIIVSLFYFGGMAVMAVWSLSLLSSVDWSSRYILSLPSLSFPRFGL